MKSAPLSETIRGEVPAGVAEIVLDRTRDPTMRTAVFTAIEAESPGYPR